MKSKHVRTMSIVGESQEKIEKATKDKFAAVQELAQPKKSKAVNNSSGRICSQISCTITSEDKELLEALTSYAINREKKVLNISVIIRALIRLGDKHKHELVFE